jgi:transposase
LTLLRLLMEYGSPAAVAACPQAASRLRRWGRSGLAQEKLQKILDSARTTVGVRMPAPTAKRLQAYAQQAFQAREQIQQTKRSLRRLAEQQAPLQPLVEVVGHVTACVLWTALGDPRDYHCGEAYRKAMGLNLKERSSGKDQGKLKITKRGPSIVRRWLYFRALRMVQKPPLRTWYQRKKAKDGGKGSRAVVAVMRKLALAAHAVTVQKEPFLLERLLPGRPRTSSEKKARPVANPR